MTTEITRTLLGLPSTFVDDLGGITLSSFWPVFEIALKTFPGDVVEIGADKGFVTKQFADACVRAGKAFYSIDPSPASAVDDIPGVNHMRMTSQNYFAHHGKTAGVWIVDGDHNFQTVLMELRSIDRLVAESDAVIFMHDIGWPSGRRDSWYNEAEAPIHAARIADGWTVSLDAGDIVKTRDGIGMGGVAAVEIVEGSQANGVMTALEAFLATPEGAKWEMRWTPIFFGFGMLVKKDSALVAENRELLDIFQAFERVRPVLAALEFNRLRLLQTVNQKWTDAADKDVEITRLRKVAGNPLLSVVEFARRVRNKLK